MIYKNFEIHNVAELIENSDGSISWVRVPHGVYEGMESKIKDVVAHDSTGVELRFIIKEGAATVRLSTGRNDPDAFGSFHIYRGGIQGGYLDFGINRHVTKDARDYVIEIPENSDKLRAMTEKLGLPWSSDVVRIIFDGGSYRIHGIEGNVKPPSSDDVPKKTMLSYGSSITHGSTSIDSSHSWVAVTAHNLGMDSRNLGMAGSCRLEPEMADYIASLGEAGKWDIATLEVGINVLGWDEETIVSRVENLLCEVAGRNGDKPVFVISPFYHWGDENKGGKAALWRSLVSDTVTRLGYKNVTYVDGLDLLGDASGISGDGVHPNIYGVQRIADRLTETIREVIAPDLRSYVSN